MSMNEIFEIIKAFFDAILNIINLLNQKGTAADGE